MRLVAGLRLADHTTAVNGIQFGADTNLYRSAAATVKTDGTVQIGDALQGVAIDPTGRMAIHSGPPTSAVLLNVGTTGTLALNSASGVFGVVTHPVNAGVGDTYGVLAQPLFSNAGGSYSYLVGVQGEIRFANATGTLASGVALRAGPPTISAGGIVAAAIGVDIVAQKVAGVTAAWGIYQRGTTDLNLFNGYVGLGVTPTARLHLVADTTAAGGISFGGDTNLYRSAAAVMRTDGALSARTGAYLGFAYSASGLLRMPNAQYMTARNAANTGDVVLLGLDASDQASVGAPLDLTRNELRNAVTHKLATAPATPVEGLRYYDTVTKNERVWDGTKWTDLTDVWVGTGAPTGTPTVGDLWYDTDDVAPVAPGTELVHVERTTTLTVAANTEATAVEAISSGARTYTTDAITLEFFCGNVQPSTVAGSQILLLLWDGATQLSRWSQQYFAAANAQSGPVLIRRRLVPTAGTHTYRVMVWAISATGNLYAGSAATEAAPMYLRITKA